MKAVIYTRKGNVATGALADPQPDDVEVLIRVRASGICHTDIDVLHGRYGEGTFPLVPGHEFAGEVVAIGGGVTNLAPGDRVVVDPNLSCGTCAACRRGRANLCGTLGAYGVTQNGGFAELCVVRASHAIPIGDMPFEMAALAEPMGCVLNGIGAVTPQAEDHALIYGAGPIGLLLAIALRTAGLKRISVADVDADRIALAESFGFDGVAVGSTALSGLRRGVNIAIDATGKTQVANGLVDMVANGGRVLFFGVCPPDEKITVSPHELFRRQITLAGTHSLNHNIPQALAAITAYGRGIANLVSHRVPLADVPAFLTGPVTGPRLKVQAVSE